MNLEDRLDDLYIEWIEFNFPDEWHTKEDLIDLFSGGFRRDEFIEEVRKYL